MYTVILNGSPKKDGNTSILINMILPKLNSGFKIINTFSKNITPCIDCQKCYTSSKCALAENDKDKTTVFLNEIEKADNIIIASPLHYSMLSGSFLNFASRFQYFYVSKYIRKDENFHIKKKRGFLLLTGGGTTKDFYPVEKVTKLILRQINASYEDTLKYINTDSMPLYRFDDFSDLEKLNLTNKINRFVEKINLSNISQK